MTTHKSEVLNLIKKSFELKLQGFFKPAIEMLYKALAFEPDNIEILLQLAYLYRQLGDLQRCVSYIEKVLDIKPKHIESLTLLEEIYVTQKNFELALETSEKIYNIEPSVENLAKKLNILNKLNNFDKIKELEVSIKEKDDKVLYEIGVAYSNKCLTDKAIENLEEGFLINNKNVKIINLLAKNYLANNDFEKAKDILAKLDESAFTCESFNYLGLIELNAKDYNNAANYFSKALEIKATNPEYSYNLASAYFLNGWFDKALKYFNKAICFAPDNTDYHYALAYLYFQKADYDKAELETKFIRKINPELNLANILNAMILAKKGDLVNAKKILEDMIKEKNNTDDFAYYALCNIYKDLDQYENAKNMMLNALYLKPDSVEYLSELVEIEFKLEKYDETLTLCNKILELNSKFVFANIFKAKIYLKKDDYENLYDCAQEIIDTDSNSYEGYYYNALALFHQGDKTFAIESLKKAISVNLNNGELYATMSSFCQECGDFRQALDWAKEASDIAPKDYKSKWLCARLAAHLNLDKDATKYFSQSYRMASFDKDLRNDYAQFLKSIGNIKKAEKILCD